MKDITIGLVSIIMPAFNAGSYISDAIQSVINQSFPNWELIIVNDGSIDKTEEIIYSFNDLRILYFKQENLGVSVARNNGLKEMTGDHFCFLDADDILPYNSLKARLEVFEKNNNIHFVDGRVEKRDESLNKLIEVYQPTYSGNPFQKLIRLNDSCFFGNTWMIRRLKEYKYQFNINITHSEDLLFYLNIAKQGLYDYTIEPVLLYRLRDNSAMTDLKGLENGYREVYRTVSSLSNVEKSDLGYLKMRIVRIMVLSYLRSCNLKQAVIAAFSLMKL